MARRHRMRAEEARSIVRHADAGDLDLSAPEVRREVERAQQTVMRERLRGDGAGRWSVRRMVVLVGAAAVALWVLGLAIATLAVAR